MSNKIVRGLKEAVKHAKGEDITASTTHVQLTDEQLRRLRGVTGGLTNIPLRMRKGAADKGKSGDGTT